MYQVSEAVWGVTQMVRRFCVKSSLHQKEPGVHMKEDARGMESGGDAHIFASGVYPSAYRSSK